MDSLMRFVTNYYWLLIIITGVLFICLLGFIVDGRKEKADEIGEKIDEKLIEEAEKKYEEEKNKTRN